MCAAWLALAKPSSHWKTVADIIAPADSTTPEKPRKKTTKPTYEPKDRYGDPYSGQNSQSPIQLKDPANYKTNVEFGDDSAGTYHVTEEVGGQPARHPSEMTYKEYQEYKQTLANRQYWRNKNTSDSTKNSDPKSGRLVPPIKMSPTLDRIFGGNVIDIKPNGNVMLDFGYQRQRIDNPAVPVRLQRMGQFIFNQTIAFNVQGKIGEKLKVGINWDTKAQFDFENNLKLDYSGLDYEIIKKVDAGNISFPINSQLIQGSQNLFGFKTEMQFGKLKVAAVIANQRGKTDEIVIQNGAQNKEIEIRADNYEDNRHYFLSQFFRDNYERALTNITMPASGVVISTIEVYVTNRISATENTRNIVGFADLGEYAPYDSLNPIYGPKTTSSPADNNINRLYNELINTPAARNVDGTTGALEGNLNLKKVEGYEMVKTARKLVLNKDYTINPILGYISLSSPLRNDDVLAVSYEYTYNGQVHRVGETSDIYGKLGNTDVIYLKLLRPTTIRTDLPMWNLQMKNVYNINQSNVRKQNFQMRIIYKDDASGIDNPSIHEGVNIANKPLLQVFNLDNFNQNLDRQPDGNFDFKGGITIDSVLGRIYFPVLEPFGNHLATQFKQPDEQNLVEKYVFKEIYRNTKSDLLNLASKNKFFLRIASASLSSGDISLPGLNIAKGSVRITAGSTQLSEGTDYTVNYDQGKITVINQGAFASGKEIRIKYEKADLFNFRQKSLTGLRLDYKYNKDINIGGTLLHLNERPLITRVNIGDEPISNTLVGADVSFLRESRTITKIIDKLPLITTKVPSTVSIQGEYAAFIPGQSSVAKGNAYIDDFEGAENPFDLTRSVLKWKVGSTPSTFPEAVSNNLNFSYKRAKLAWYSIDNVFYTDASNKPSNIDDEDIKNHYVRAVQPQEIFPNKDRTQAQLNEPIFDMVYYPSERGPYNYNPNLKSDGTLNNDPRENYAAITRSISTDTDFDNANIQYIEFWLMDPFLKGSKYSGIPVKKKDGSGDSLINNTKGGKMYFNLGSISEDVLKDQQQSFENGLPTNGYSSINTKSTQWGVVTQLPYLNDAFVPNFRSTQDVGLDGLNSSSENDYYKTNFLDQITDPSAKDVASKDPSADDFKHYLDPSNTASGLKIVDRYKYWNGLENNSPENTGGTSFTPSSTNNPDNEDLNQNNTINDLEQYFEYEVDITPSSLKNGNKYVISKVTGNQNGDTVTWYQFRIPIRDPSAKNVNNITDFKSIRFMRMYLTGWSEPVALRLAEFQLVAGQWRAYNPASDLNEKTAEKIPEPVNTGFTVSTVNIEENGQGPIPYVVPPGFIRDRDNTSNVSRRLNEQSLRMCVDDLGDGRARAVFKNTNFNFVNYGRMNMFVHAQSETIKHNDSTTLVAFVRLGTDFTQNYYEIEIPLKYTLNPTSNPDEIWRSDNTLDMSFDALSGTKAARNRITGYDQRIPFTRFVEGRNVTIVGNPDFSSVQVVMLGIKNPLSGEAKPYSACVWMDEFRVTDFQNEISQAAIGKINTKLADVANVTASGRYMGIGFGSLEQKISQRNLNEQKDYGIQTNISLEKLLPTKSGMKIPLFMSYDKTQATPKYDPTNPDVKLDASLNAIEDEIKREELRQKLITQSVKRSINIQGLQKTKTKPNAKKHIYDVENLTLSGSYSDGISSSYTLAEDRTLNYKSSVIYNYTSSPKNYEPLKKVKFLSNPYLKLIKDFNLTLMPSTLSFSGDLNRDYRKTQNRNSNLGIEGIAPQFIKNFTFNRKYAFNWAFTKSLSLNYSSTVYALIDENIGEIGTKSNDEVIKENLKKFGRTRNYDQSITATYKLPLDKLPFTDWLSAETKYGTRYGWQAGTLGTSDTLGNTISNTREKGVNGKVDLLKLYNKVKFLKAINNPIPKPKPLPGDTTKPKPEYKLVKGIFKKLMMVKSVNISYTLTEGTSVPGFMPKVKYLGMENSDIRNIVGAPGLPFLIGSQDVETFTREGINNNWFSKDSRINNPITQNFTENLNLKTQIEPFKDFKIQIEAKRDRTGKYSEVLKNDTLTNEFEHLSAQRSGTYSISFFSLPTAFKGYGKNNSSSVFDQFVTNRTLIRNRLNSNPELQNKGLAYSINDQDVLIASFIAAYSGSDASKSSLSSFPKIPLPQWRVDYAGLSQLASVKKIFSSVSINHSYSSTYSVASYQSPLNTPYTELTLNNSELEYKTPSNSVDGNITPIYRVTNVLIKESFSPLIGVNVKTLKNATFKVEYKKSRDLSLSIGSQGQVTEMTNNELVVGYGLTKKGMELNFLKIFNGGVAPPPLKNDVTFRFDLRLSDVKTVLRNIEGNTSVTAGNLLVSIKPNINYVVNQKMNMQFYFDKTINNPKVSTAFYRVTTLFGIQIKFILS